MNIEYARMANIRTSSNSNSNFVTFLDNCVDLVELPSSNFVICCIGLVFLVTILSFTDFSCEDA